MRCWDCGTFKPTAVGIYGRCSEKLDPGNHPDGKLIHGRSHGCSKWTRTKKIEKQ